MQRSARHSVTPVGFDTWALPALLSGCVCGWQFSWMQRLVTVDVGVRHGCGGVGASHVIRDEMKCHRSRNRYAWRQCLNVFVAGVV